MTDLQLKAFILYTQAVEAAYHEWKNYWIDVYMNDDKNKDLYDGSEYIDNYTKWLSETLSIKWPNQK